MDYVLLVNVLHEIESKYWCEIFSNIYNLLKNDGKLIIVEREELTIGERAYDNGFLVITQEGADALFEKEGYRRDTHRKKPYIVKYTINRQSLQISSEKITECIKQIKQHALRQISQLKCSQPLQNDLEKYRAGIKLAFQLHQYANASLILGEA